MENPVSETAPETTQKKCIYCGSSLDSSAAVCDREIRRILSRPHFPHYRRTPVSTVEVGPGFRRDSGKFDPANSGTGTLGQTDLSEEVGTPNATPGCAVWEVPGRGRFDKTAPLILPHFHVIVLVATAVRGRRAHRWRS